jgi:hypothetical protein
MAARRRRHTLGPYRERHAGPFLRPLRVPYPVDRRAMGVAYRDGVFIMMVPKADDQRARLVACEGQGTSSSTCCGRPPTGRTALPGSSGGSERSIAVTRSPITGEGEKLVQALSVGKEGSWRATAQGSEACHPCAVAPQAPSITKFY